MGSGISKITSKKRQSLIKKIGASLLMLFHTVEQIAKTSHDRAFDFEKLRDFLWITPMMRKVVVFRGHSVNEGNPMIILDHNADHAG